MGPALPGDDPVVGQRLGRVHPVPGLRHRDPHGDLLDECDRELERPLSASDQGPQPLPHRAGSVEVALPGDPITRPHRHRRARWTMRWKPALNAFAITFADRFPAAEDY